MVVKWWKKAEMISVQDVKYVLEVILPKKKVTDKEILAILAFFLIKKNKT